LMKKNGIGYRDIAEIAVGMAPVEIDTVDNRAMSDISIQHLVALLLIDGDLTFDTSHDAERMHDPIVATVKQKITLVPDPLREPRRAHVTIVTNGNQSFLHQAGPVHGSPENPMTREDVDRKAFDLLTPVLGKASAQELIDTVWQIGSLNDIRGLRKYLRSP